jgi:type III pantothenate kinase
MLLGFDIGNTNTVMGIYGEHDTSPAGIFRFRTARDATSDELAVLVRGFLDSRGEGPATVSGIAFASVVPEINRAYHSLAKEYFGIGAVEITARSKLDISIRYDSPEQLGVDRLVNAEAAYREYAKDCIIIDIGTATTFCVLHGTGAYDGGLIGPGIGVTIDALAARASQLPRIVFGKPSSLIATNTVDALKSGFFYGWLSMVEGVIGRIEAHYGASFLHLFTGGYSAFLSPVMSAGHVLDPLLTMKGIKYIYDHNRVH